MQESTPSQQNLEPVVIGGSLNGIPALDLSQGTCASEDLGIYRDPGTNLHKQRVTIQVKRPGSRMFAS